MIFVLNQQSVDRDRDPSEMQQCEKLSRQIDISLIIVPIICLYNFINLLNQQTIHKTTIFQV